jgi:hypothetical protein
MISGCVHRRLDSRALDFQKKDFSASCAIAPSSVVFNAACRIAFRIARATCPSLAGARRMKKAITVRLDPDLLEEVRLNAERENRTVTNFIATALKERIKSDSGRNSSEKDSDRR